MKNILFLLLFLFTQLSLSGQQNAYPIVTSDQETNLYGAVDADGNIVIPFEYDLLKQFCEGVSVAVKNKRYFFIDVNGKRASEKDYDFLTSLLDGKAVASDKRKVSLVTKDNEVIIEPGKYEFLHLFPHGLISATNIERKKGMIDENEKVIYPFEYNGLLSYLDLVFLRKDKLWAVADTKGNLISDFEFSRISHNAGEDHVSVVKEDQRYTMNHEGKILEDLLIVSAFSNGYAQCVKNDRYGFVNRDYELAIDYQFHKVFSFKNEKCIVKDDMGNFGIIDKTGRYILPLTHRWIIQSSDRFYSISKGDSIMIADANLEPIVDELFEFPPMIAFDDYRESSGLIKIWQDGKIGFIDTTGTRKVEPIYDNVEKKLGGYRLVSIDNKWGVIDPDFKQLIPIEFDKIYNKGFGGYFRVMKLVNGVEKFGLYRLDNLLLEVEYDEIDMRKFDEFRARKGDEWKSIEKKDDSPF